MTILKYLIAHTKTNIKYKSFLNYKQWMIIKLPTNKTKVSRNESQSWVCQSSAFEKIEIIVFIDSTCSRTNHKNSLLSFNFWPRGVIKGGVQETQKHKSIIIGERFSRTCLRQNVSHIKIYNLVEFSFYQRFELTKFNHCHLIESVFDIPQKLIVSERTIPISETNTSNQQFLQWK